MTLREIGEKRIRARSERLVKLLDLDAPDNIISMEVALVVDAATLLYGPVFFQAHGQLQQRRLRGAAGFCPNCENPSSMPAHDWERYCQKCIDEAETEAGDDGPGQLLDFPKPGPQV